MRRPARRAAILFTTLAFAATGAIVFAGGATAGASDPTPYYLAVGGSGSVGFQPTSARPHGEPTGSGYADDLAGRLAARWPGLNLVRIGCPGATTETMMEGGGHCAYAAASQLETALDFLHTHPSTVLVTVDLGFNDVIPCLRHMVVDTDCVSTALSSVASQLPRILTALRRAAPDDARILGVGHYDPFVADEIRGPIGDTFADASVGVIERLDEVLRAAYAHAGIAMADIGRAFDLQDTSPVDVPGLGVVPTDVARVCSLTWMCAAPPLGPNTHPNDDGYRVESNALAAALS
ncbi:MAG TPA: SGNH/GDSL hydrolase family protein [Acidimicrobiales bacterium]